MVFLVPNSNVPRLQAYLLPSFPLSELPALKRTFEFGTCAPFYPMLELVVAHAPADWAGQSFEYMRRRETEAGREQGFVVVDERGAGGREGAVWYVDRLANENEVARGQATSTDVAWRILVKTECLALVWVNYDIANMTLQEDLCNLGVRFPVDAGYEVHVADNCGGLDMERERRSKHTVVVAEPGEFVESTDERLRKNYLPRPERVARLKDGLAEMIGVVNDWSIPRSVRQKGFHMQFPEGSVELWLKYDPDFDWPEYEWPEGSL